MGDKNIRLAILAVLLVSLSAFNQSTKANPISNIPAYIAPAILARLVTTKSPLYRASSVTKGKANTKLRNSPTTGSHLLLVLKIQ